MRKVKNSRERLIDNKSNSLKQHLKRKDMKKLLYILVAGAAILAVGCDKTGDDTGNTADGKVTSKDFVGSWAQGGETVYVFKEDGSYTESRWGDNTSGKWSFSETGSTITLTPTGKEAQTVKVLMIGGKAWLVIVDESENDQFSYRSTESFRKVGAKVESGPLGDGRWDAPHSGVKPAEYTADTDYRLCFLISGKTIDVYVPMWGYHIQGSFTFNDGKLHIETDDDHIWAGKEISYTDSYNWSFGWNASGDGPDDGFSMNPETFELRGYTWYTVNALKGMGHQPQGDSDFSFEAAIWNEGQQLHEEAMDLCDFEICVTPDGKEAYGNAGGMGLPLCCYKR